MLIPLGILAAAGFRPTAGGSYDLLATEILTSSQASVTFSSLNTLAAGYQHLQIRYTVRSSYSFDARAPIRITFNGDTASNYNSHYLGGDGSSVFSGSSLTSYMFGGDIDVRTASGSEYSPGVIDVLDFAESTKYKTIRCLGASSIGQNLFLTSGSWRNTAALTSVTLSAIPGWAFYSGSRFSLYGLKASA